MQECTEHSCGDMGFQHLQLCQISQHTEQLQANLGEQDELAKKSHFGALQNSGKNILGIFKP